MKNQKIDTDYLDIECTQAIQHLKNLPGFQLYEEDEFIRLVYTRCLQENLHGPEPVFQSAALNIYAEGLYLAVSSRDDLPRQELGFQELSKYLYRMAYNFFLHQTMDFNDGSDKARDCTQTALERIYFHLGDVKTPGGFLKWCGVILRNCCLEKVRNQKMEIPIEGDLFENEMAGESDGLDLDSATDRGCLLAAILRLKGEYQTVIRLSYFLEEGEKIGDREIAHRLNITIGNLYTLRSRALSALRKDKKLLECLQGSL